MKAFVRRVYYRKVRDVVLAMRPLRVALNVQSQDAGREVKVLLSKDRELGER